MDWTQMTDRAEIEPNSSDRPQRRTPPPVPAYPRTTVVPIVLFLFGSLMAALYTFVLFPRQSAIAGAIDVNRLGEIARHVAAGDGFSQGWGPTVRRAPLFPAFAGAIIHFSGWQGPDAVVFRPVQAAQCLVLGLTCVVVWAAARKLFGPRTAIIAGALAAVAPQSLRYVPMAEVETLMGLAIALMALTSVNLSLRPTLWNGALLGLASGAATLLKPIAELYPALFGILLWLAWRKRSPGSDPGSRSDSGSGSGSGSRAVAAAVCSLVVLAAVVAPWMVRNAVVTHGQFTGIGSNAPGEFLRGYVLAQPGYYLLRQDFGGSEPGKMQWDWEANLFEDALLRKHGMSAFSTTRFGPNGQPMPLEESIPSELGKDRIEGAEVMRRIRHDPQGVAAKFFIQLFTFWYIVETRTKSLVVGGIAAAAIALAAFGAVRARRKGLVVYPIVSLLLYFNAIYALFLGLARYSMPLFPTLLILSAYGGTQLLTGRTVRPPVDGAG
jgi:hypothetical protein